MTVNNFATIYADLCPDLLARSFHLSDVVLPFHGYRKALPMLTIVRLEGEGNYSTFHFNDGSRLMVSLTLKRLFARLSPDVFARPHKKTIVNMLYLEETDHSRQQPAVLLTNGDRVEVSRRKANLFFNQFAGFKQKISQLAS